MPGLWQRFKRGLCDHTVQLPPLFHRNPAIFMPLEERHRAANRCILGFDLIRVFLIHLRNLAIERCLADLRNPESLIAGKRL